MIDIDLSKCIKCESCVQECPIYVFHSMANGDHYGKAYAKYEDQCCKCYHCVAICPVGAIKLNGTSLNDLERLNNIDINSDQMRNLIYSRRSIRSFKDEPVEDEFINELIEMATHAGTTSNDQSEGFIILKNKDKIEEIERDVINVFWSSVLKYFGSNGIITKLLSKKMGEKMVHTLKRYHKTFKNRTADDNLKGMIFRNAPAVILMYGPSFNDIGKINSALALRNVELYALTRGYGTMYCGFMVSTFNRKPNIFREKLGINKYESVFGVLLIGKPKRSHIYKLPRKPRNIMFV